MKINEKIVNAVRASFIASSIAISFLILYPKIYSFSAFLSNFDVFVVTESLIIYSLAMSIRPSLKSIGIAMVLSGLLLPLIRPEIFVQTFSSFTLSSIFYILFIAIVVVMILVSLFFGSIGLQITYAVLTILVLLPILQYSFLNIKCFSCAFKYLPYSTFFQNPINIFYTFVSIVGFTLSASKKTEALTFNAIRNVSLPYFLSSLLPLTFILLISDNLTPSYLMGFVNPLILYLTISMLLFAVIGGIIFRNKLDLEFSLIISLTSLGLAWISFLYSPYYPLFFLILGASVIPIGIADPQVIENKLFNAINSNLYNRAERYLNALLKLNYSHTKIFCDAASRFDCNTMSWIYSKSAGKIIYNNCNSLSNVVNCIISNNIVLFDAPNLLDVLMQKDKNSAEKLASYLLTKNLPQPVKEKAKSVLASLLGVEAKPSIPKLPPLDNWDPNVWIGSNLYGYKVTKILGSGGSSYVLVSERNNQKFAIKITKISKSNVNDILSLFESVSKESSNLQSISEKSPHIVRIYGFFADLNNIKDIVSGKSEVYYSSPPAIIMELMDGGTADDLIKNQAVVLSNYWKKAVALISLSIANALKVIHQEGYVHLDIKPANIFFNKSPGRTAEEIYENIKNGEVLVKLGDLGSARRIGERVLEYTPQYCSIDQVDAMLSKKGADVKMDIYAFGSTIYKMLTQRQFNPPKVAGLMDEAVQFYINNKPYSLFLDSARKELTTFHQNLSLSQEYAEFTLLIKAMTSPNPLQRPSIDYVIAELNKLA
ncbi:protein kinase [Acidianus sp. HS-5]|uniref:protein kinase domain-containing protein n=1 Tax=Acidianus sp. HS-5 TaxID=2886040 RepID=UPI001F026493|nr:protein kinase [Acidianus sp. HS-5]BDC17981.1 serine/threonine protein kinase [Acidianus sp. HS-5]